MKLNKTIKGVIMKVNALKSLAVISATAVLSACGGGGGGGTQPVPYEPLDIVKYPYETVYGDACKTSEPTPGCTFSRSTGKRITVSVDPDYSRYGYGSDDLSYVKFDRSGNGKVYNDRGDYVRSVTPSEFPGYVGGTTIGVGQTGSFWENVSGRDYWIGKNNVLYNANTGSVNYGQAINSKGSTQASDANSKAINSSVNKQLIRSGAAKLVTQYGLSQGKAVAVASALNSWAVMGAERGKVTPADMDKTFSTVFGVKFSDALATVNAFRTGDSNAYAKARDLTNRTANHLGLRPDQAQTFIKGMYKRAIQDVGLNPNDLKW